MSTISENSTPEYLEAPFAVVIVAAVLISFTEDIHHFLANKVSKCLINTIGYR